MREHDMQNSIKDVASRYVAVHIIKLRHAGFERVKLINTASAQTVLLEAKTPKISSK